MGYRYSLIKVEEGAQKIIDAYRNKAESIQAAKYHCGGYYNSKMWCEVYDTGKCETVFNTNDWRMPAVLKRMTKRRVG